MAAFAKNRPALHWGARTQANRVPATCLDTMLGYAVKARAPVFNGQKNDFGNA